MVQCSSIDIQKSGLALMLGSYPFSVSAS